MQEAWRSEVVSQKLRVLGKSEKWWVRLWVAEFMRQLPELRNEETWEQLREDPDPLVRERATRAVFKSATEPANDKSER
jgi:hypothetical protein